MDAIVEDGLRKGGPFRSKAQVELPLRDGDYQLPDGIFHNCFYLNVSSIDAPQVFDYKLNPITYHESFFSGCLARVSLTFYPYWINQKRYGVGFVDWCFFKAYGAVEGQRIQCQTGPLGAGCVYSAQYYQQKGRYDKNPKVGDQVFFQTGGQIGHTGIVVEVTGSSIVTVEGNSSDQVRKNTYLRSNDYIAGYGHPLYSDTAVFAETPAPAAVPAPETEPATVTCIISLPLLKNGATGVAVTNAQTLLISKGYPCGGRVTAGWETADGDFGPATERSVKNFQAKKNLAADGVIGAATWKALLTA